MYFIEWCAIYALPPIYSMTLMIIYRIQSGIKRTCTLYRSIPAGRRPISTGRSSPVYNSKGRSEGCILFLAAVAHHRKADFNRVRTSVDMATGRRPVRSAYKKAYKKATTTKMYLICTYSILNLPFVLTRSSCCAMQCYTANLEMKNLYSQKKGYKEKTRNMSDSIVPSGSPIYSPNRLIQRSRR